MRDGADRREAARLPYPPVEGLIFDFDGTLVDSEPLYAESDGEFLAGFGIDLGGEGKTRYLGIGTRDFFLDLESSFPDSPLSALPLEERIRLKDEAYMAAAAGRLRAFPGVLDLARELRRRGLRLALASGSSLAVVEAGLDAIGARGLFPVVLSATELPRGKPDPAIFLEAARRLALGGGSCAVFEDSLAGLAAAKAALMRCVALPAPGSEEAAFSDADFIVRGGAAALELDPILSLLETWGAARRVESSSS